MHENLYLTLAPQLRGLAAASGFLVQVAWSLGDSGSSSKGPVLDIAIPDRTEDQDVDSHAALVAEVLGKAWKAGLPAGTLPSLVRVKGHGNFTVQVDGPLPRASRADVVRNRIALVTGGAQGFGEEITRGLIANGAFVVIADMNLDGAERLATELNQAAGKTVSFAVAVNVSDDASVAAMMATVVAKAGGLDILVANAGVLKASPLLSQDLKSFEFVTAVNYTGYMLCAKYAARVMREQNRSNPQGWTDIIQINSKSGLEGSNKNASYAGSKFGSIGLTQSFALELVNYRIKVNSICPGNFFDGPLWSDPVKGLFVQYLNAGKVKGATSIADVKKFYEEKVPMARGCTGTDVLRALFYIVEQEYETGQAVPVTGGQVMMN